MNKQTFQIAQESYRLLVENVKDYAIFMIDAAGHVISWNKGAQHIKGYISNEVIGKHISIFYRAGEIENGEPVKDLQKAKELGQLEVEGWRVCKDASVFWANVVFTAMKDDQSNLIGFGKIIRDMTPQKRKSVKIKSSNTRLEDQYKKVNLK